MGGKQPLAQWSLLPPVACEVSNLELYAVHMYTWCQLRLETRSLSNKHSIMIPHIVAANIVAMQSSLLQLTTEFSYYVVFPYSLHVVKRRQQFQTSLILNDMCFCLQLNSPFIVSLAEIKQWKCSRVWKTLKVRQWTIMRIAFCKKWKILKTESVLWLLRDRVCFQVLGRRLKEKGKWEKDGWNTV